MRCPVCLGGGALRCPVCLEGDGEISCLSRGGGAVRCPFLFGGGQGDILFVWRGL